MNSTTEIDSVLSARGKTHGSYPINAARSMQIHDIIDRKTLPEPIRLALFMIGHKMSRISAGDFSEPDHWTDIIGYATLAKQYLAGDFNE